MTTSFSTLCDALNLASEYDELVRVNNIRRLSTLAKTYQNIMNGKCQPIARLSPELQTSFMKIATEYNEAVNYVE